jgi:hypothetical protein
MIALVIEPVFIGRWLKDADADMSGTESFVT